MVIFVYVCEVLTHLYLLLGCSLPVWLECFLVPVVQPNVRPMAGLLLIGIGDSCAALVGTSDRSHGDGCKQPLRFTKLGTYPVAEFGFRMKKVGNIETRYDVMVLQGCFMFLLVHICAKMSKSCSFFQMGLKMMNHTGGFWTVFFPNLFLKFPAVWSPLVQERGHRNKLPNLCTHHGKKLQFVINLIAKKQWEGIGFIFFNLLPKKPSQRNNKKPGIRFGHRKWPGSHRTLLGTMAFVFSVTLAASILCPSRAFGKASLDCPFCPVRFCDFACRNQFFNFR